MHSELLLLNNWRRHREHYSDPSGAALDRYSSAISFTGWIGRWKPPRDHDPLPVSPPRTSLLDNAWRWYGLIDPYEVPGPLGP